MAYFMALLIAEFCNDPHSLFALHKHRIYALAV